MSTRDELRSDLSVVKGLRAAKLDDLTDWMHSKGWRKMPARQQVADEIAARIDHEGFNIYDLADAILALMDGGQ